VARILIVDDDAGLRRALGDRMRFWEHAVDEAADLAAGRAALARRGYDVVLLDLQLPDGSGLDLLAEIRAGESPVDVIMLTAHGSIEAAVAAIRAGASDFLAKPADFELLRAALDRIFERRRLARANSAFEERLAEGADPFVAESEPMRALLALAAQAARSNATVLITGESGTGKQKLAEFVHRESARAAGPLVYVNCVALPSQLVDSTLFGHEKGAFTGATEKKPGRFEAAEGGTAFLDEIGEIAPEVQARLLHFLETGEFERVGGTKTLKVDCRIVAATNRDLAAAIQAGTFREDLFWRLNVIALRMPPLRERREEIPALARALARGLAREAGRPAPTFAPRTLELLAAQEWPGNIRQLRNAIHRMIALAPGDELTPDLLPAGDAAPLPSTDLKTAIDRFRKEHVVAVLARTQGHRTRAAELLGIQRTHLSVLLKKYGLNDE
jgi:two-component system response regulator HydG